MAKTSKIIGRIPVGRTYTEGMQCYQGNIVTVGDVAWLALQDTTEAPSAESSAWRVWSGTPGVSSRLSSLETDMAQAGASIEALNTEAQAEAQARQGADESLSQQIEAEAQERQGADDTLSQKLSAEAEARQQADTSLAGRVSTVEEAIADGVGTVKGITVNGQQQTPNADGIIALTIEDAPADESLDINSTNPIQNKAVAQRINQIEATALANIEMDEGEDEVTLSFTNKTGGEIASVTIPALGGGGGTGDTGYTKITLTAAVDNPVIKEGGTAVLTYAYSAKDSDGNDANVRATIDIEVKRGAVTVLSRTITDVGRGTYELDLSSVLSTGAHDINVRATILDPETNTQRKRTAYASVYVSALTLTSNFSLTEMAAAGGYSGSTMTLPYVVSGAGNKTIKLYVNGVQQQTQTQNLSGNRPGEFAVALGSLTPGRHSLQIVAEANIDGHALTSESIYVEIVKRGLTGPWVCVMMSCADGTIFTSSATPAVQGGQYEPVEVKYAAYDPDDESATVAVSVDNKLMQTVSAPRSMQTLTLRFTDKGTHPIDFSVNSQTSGMARRKISAIIAESGLGLSIATASLTHQLTAAGRSNAEADPATWENQADTTGANIATFTGVDFSTSGWDGECLTLRNGAALSLDIRPFASDVKSTGLTLEMIVKVSTVADKAATLISCMDSGKGLSITSDTISYLTGQTVQYTDENGVSGTRTVGMTTKYVCGEWMRIAVDITAAATDRLMELYVNGGRRGADIYDANFSFAQDTPAPIVFDSTGADIAIKRIRLYSRGLSDDELLENSIIEADSVSEMIAQKQENDVLDSETGDIDLDKVLKKGRGVIRIVRQGRLEDVYQTNDKSQDFSADVYYWPSDIAKAAGAKAFVVTDCNIRIQGTSSTKYPSKNIRIYLNKGGASLSLTIDGIETADRRYSLRTGTPAQAVLCAKSDYSDSSMSLNTGGAKMFNDTFKAMSLLTPPQRWQQSQGKDVTVRAAIDGWPVDIFASDSVDGANVFYGQYNLNNEKSKSGELFGMTGVEGFTPACPIALESLNNTEGCALFQSTGDVMSYLASRFDAGFEVNYSASGADGDVKWASLSSAEQSAVYRLFSFLAQCYNERQDRDDSDMETWECETFRDGLSEYFDVDYLCTYYLWTDYYLAVDQRAKNILWRTWDGLKWYPTYYDGDTQMGKRNDSFLVYGYDTGRDTWDSQVGKYAFEGRSSWLWNFLLANFEDRLAACASNLRQAMTTAAVLQMYNGMQTGSWSEREFNKSGYLKYINPALHTVYGQTWPYIYALQGSNKEHREYMVRNRFALLDAKYACGDYRNDNIDMYLQQDAGALSSMVITPTEQYAFGYGTNNLPYIGSTGVTSSEATLTISGAYTVNDPVRVYGASRMLKLDLRATVFNLRNGIQLDKCTSMRELNVSAVDAASAAPAGWFLALSGCVQLRKLTARYQTYVRTGSATSATVDLSGCLRFESLDIRDTAVEHVVFAAGAPVTAVYLPTTLRSLRLDHHASLLSSGLVLQGKDNLRSLEIYDCPGLADSHTLVLDWLTRKTTADNLCSLKLSGMAWSGVTAAQMLRIAQLGTVELQGTVALSARPSAQEALDLIEAYGEGVFSGSGRLRFSAPGGLMIAAPAEVYEGTTISDATVARVILLDPALTNINLSATTSGAVTADVDTEALTVTIYSDESAAAGRKVTIEAYGNVPGETRQTATATVSILPKVYPSAFTLDAPSVLSAGQTYNVELIPDSTEGVNGSWSTVWSISSTDKVTISERTATSCTLTVAADATVVLAELTAEVYKNNATSAYTSVSTDMECLTADVLMTSHSNPEVMAVCYAQGWAANENYMTYDEAAAVTNSQIAYFDFRNKGIVHFNEFKYFVNITTLPGGQGAHKYFYEDKTIKEITLPDNLVTMGGNFCNHSPIERYIIGSKVTALGFNGLANMPYLKELYIYAKQAPSSTHIAFDNLGKNVGVTKTLYVPVGATGYDEGGWLGANSDNGWTISYTL